MGGRIAHARLAVGLTQQQLADQCGISRPVIIYIEKGKRKSIKTELLEAIATFTGFRSEWLVYGTGPQKQSDDPLDAQVLALAGQMTVAEIRDSLLAVALTLPDDEMAILISDLEDALDA